jgi:hypothetical protein
LNQPPRELWLVLALVTFANYGNFYVYDSMAGANLVAGWLNDSYSASALNPAGYQPMMLFFFTSGALGFGFAMMLWLTAGRRRHEAITYAR